MVPAASPLEPLQMPVALGDLQDHIVRKAVPKRRDHWIKLFLCALEWPRVLLAMGEGCWTTCLLQVLLFPLFAAEEMQQTGLSNNSVQCLNNYGSQGRRVNCTWHRRDTILGEGPFHLNFSDLLGLNSDLICHLSEEALDQFSCSVNSEEGEFTENDEYSVSLYASSSSRNGLIVFTMYEPRLHIKCEPPFDLQSNMSSSKCWMQWRRPEAYEDIFLDDWQWELAFKTTEAPWEQAQNKVWVNKETWVEIEGFEFESGVEYVARIRCKTPDVNTHYRSQWSPWSATTKWKAPPGNGRQQHRESHLLKHVFNLLFLCLGILLFLLLVLTIFWRSKGHCSANIPSPAAYFQPLYLSHSGDFKRWAGLAEKSGGNEDKEMPWHPSKGVEEDKAPPGGISRLSFCQPPPEDEALSKESSCPPPEMQDYQYMASKQRGLEGDLKQPQPEAEAPLPSGETEQESSSSLPCEWGLTFQEMGPLETETPALLLLFGSNDYCALGGGHSQPGSRPAAEQLLQSISAWGPGQAAKDSPQAVLGPTSHA
ncbi:interleukin-9 receptor-like [Podarcis raffonei]|uniref:interleukin-9 receptor-like n=1 Tax=Podarcis raffonei TaxID=65483 RepID=UPI00232946AB|nr:interleukin-9 receptor-like [Podarcis raffonei]